MFLLNRRLQLKKKKKKKEDCNFSPSSHFWFLNQKTEFFPFKERRTACFLPPHPSTFTCRVSLGPLTWWEQGCSTSGLSLWLSSCQMRHPFPHSTSASQRGGVEEAHSSRTPGLSRQSCEKRFIQKRFENAGAKYVKNFIMKCKCRLDFSQYICVFLNRRHSTWGHLLSASLSTAKFLSRDEA